MMSWIRIWGGLCLIVALAVWSLFWSKNTSTPIEQTRFAKIYATYFPGMAAVGCGSSYREVLVDSCVVNLTGETLEQAKERLQQKGWQAVIDHADVMSFCKQGVMIRISDYKERYLYAVSLNSIECPMASGAPLPE